MKAEQISIGGEYEVLKQFGGAMGHVYLVKKQGVDYPFVLKSFQLSKPQLEELFKKEVKNWASFGVHPNIVKALFAEKIDNRLYVGAEYVEPNENGDNRLTDYCGRELPLHLIIKWAIQFTYGMNHCVGKGMIAHSDIKPDNILVDTDLNLKITDFGLSKSIINDELSGGGTPYYFSPEQIVDSTNIDYRSDIYSFGIILYKLITKGGFPYKLSSNDMAKITMIELLQAHITEEVISINHPLFAICKKCLSKKPDNRYQQFQDLFKDIVEVAKLNNIDIPKQNISADNESEEVYLLSRSLSATGNKSGALEAINRYIKQCPEHDIAWTQKGRLEYELGKYEDALESTKQAVSLYQYSTSALNNLGIIYFNLGSYNESKTCLLRAVEIAPNNSGALMNLANTLIETGNIEESAQCVIQCFNLTPTKLTLHSNTKSLLPFYINSSLFEFSADLYSMLDKYSELSPSDCFNAAMCNYQIHRFTESINFFNRVLSNNNKDEQAIVNISKAYFFTYNTELAIEYAEKLIKENINPVNGMSMKAQYLHKTGKFKEAEKYLSEILNQYPMTDYLWVTIGDIYLAEKMYSKSLDSYQKAKQILEQKGQGNDSNIDFITQKINQIKPHLIQ